MDNGSVDAQATKRSADSARLEADIAHLDRISTMLDSTFRVPGTSIRFGWDSLLGLVPGLGDVVTVGPAIYLIYRAHRMGARKRTLARMAVNSGLDLLIGAAPVVGDVFDLFFKANNRNVALLRDDLERRAKRLG